MTLKLCFSNQSDVRISLNATKFFYFLASISNCMQLQLGYVLLSRKIKVQFYSPKTFLPAGSNSSPPSLVCHHLGQASLMFGLFVSHYVMRCFQTGMSRPYQFSNTVRFVWQV